MKTTIELKSGTVLQRSAVITLTADQLTQHMADVAMFTQPVRVVDSVAAFFADRNFFAAIDAGDMDTVRMIAEHRDVHLDIADEHLVSKFAKFKLDLNVRLQATRPVYHFAEVPDDWNVESRLNITRKTIQRKRSSHYEISLKSAERVWLVCAARWQNAAASSVVRRVAASGYTRDASIQDDHVNIGCQRVERYELEQLAVKMDWAFPSRPN
jgi:uncharacterized protein (DUF2384 family)